MRAFYLAYSKEVTISAQPVPKLAETESAQAVPIQEGQSPPAAVAQIPYVDTSEEESVPRYAHQATLDEIPESEFNLNIPIPETPRRRKR